MYLQAVGKSLVLPLGEWERNGSENLSWSGLGARIDPSQKVTGGVQEGLILEHESGMGARPPPAGTSALGAHGELMT